MNRDSNESKSIKPYLSLRELSKQTYPYQNEEYAYKKTLLNFKAVCEQQKLNIEEFRSGRQYRIPQTGKTTWVSLIRSMDLVDKKTEPTLGDFDFYFSELIKTRREIETRDQNPTEFSLEDDATFLEMFYAPDGKQNLIADYYRTYVMDYLSEDFDYIQNNASDDRIVLYSEMYHDHAMFELKKIRNRIRALIEKK